MKDSADRIYINSFAKGLALTMSFSKERPRLSLTEVAKAKQMNLVTAKHVEGGRGALLDKIQYHLQSRHG